MDIVSRAVTFAFRFEGSRRVIGWKIDFIGDCFILFPRINGIWFYLVFFFLLKILFFVIT